MNSHKTISQKNLALLGMAMLTLLPISRSMLAQSAAALKEAWRNKPVADWTEVDAQQILERSPWAKPTVAGIARRQSEDERRAGGNMGQPTGVGFDGIDDKRVRPVLPTSVFTAAPTPPSRAQLIRLLVR